nr:hypothetical protein [Tanacetum cinerariifolium]
MVFRLVDGNFLDCPPDSYHPPHPTYEIYSGDTCGNDSHFGSDCPPQFPVNYEPEPGYIQNYNSYPHDSSSFPQQYPCCKDCGGLLEADHCQPPQYTVNHPIFNAHHDLLVIISSKIDSLFDEFAGELTLLKSFPSGIDKTDCHPEEEIRLTKRLLYENSSPRPPEEIIFDNSNADIESFSPSHIPVEDSDLSFNPDDPMPPGIEDDDYDSERDIPILEELLDNYSISLPANESYHFDIPSPYRPPAKPPDG